MRLMQDCYLCLTSIALFSGLAAGQSSTVSFLFPDANSRQVFNQEDTVVISWTTNYAHRWLLNWCKDSASGGSYFSDAPIPVGDTGTSIAYQINQNRTVWPAYCRPALTYNQSSGAGQEIDIKNDLTWTSTSGLPTTWLRDTSIVGISTTEVVTVTASATVTQSALSSALGGSAAPFTATSTSSSPPSTSSADSGTGGDSGLSAGAKAGIGVGVSLGVLAVVGALIYMLKFRKKKIIGAPMMGELSGDGKPPQPYEMQNAKPFGGYPPSQQYPTPQQHPAQLYGSVPQGYAGQHNIAQPFQRPFEVDGTPQH